MSNNNYKFYGVLVGLLVSIMLTCDALSFKVVDFFGYDIAASGLLFSFSFPLAAIATDVYGYKLAIRIVWIQFFSQIFFITIISIFVRFSYKHDPVAILYFDLYNQLWRVLLAASIAVPISYFINDFLMSIIKIYYKGNYIILRFIVSNVAGSAALVCISYPINFYKIYSLQHIFTIALNTWFLKVAMAALLLPVTVILSLLLKKLEKRDFYDYGISYNPFKAFTSNDQGKNKWGN